MKRILFAIAAVALLSLPALAAQDTATAAVEIKVEPYCEFKVASSLGVLDMIVNQDQDPLPDVHEGLHQATLNFEFWCNTECTLTVESEHTSGQVIETPGAPGVVGDLYPTAYIGNDPANAGIGFGLAVTVEGGPWIPYLPDSGSPQTVPGKSQQTVAAGKNDGTLKINTYVDSGRNAPDNLAPPGDYVGQLNLTLTTIP